MKVLTVKWAKLSLSLLLVLSLLPWGSANTNTVQAALVENVYSFGRGDLGQLGHGSDVADKLSPKIIEALAGLNITAVSAGHEHTLVLTAAGEVYSFGKGADGRLGHGDEEDVELPKRIEALVGKRIIAIEAGIGLVNGFHAHSLVLTDEGEVYSFGYGSSGQLGHGDNLNQLTPKEITGIPKIKAIAAGGGHSLLVTDVGGQVYSFGAGGEGRLGLGNTVGRNIPSPIDDLTNVAAVSAGQDFSLALTEDGKVYSFGRGFEGRLGLGSDVSNRLTPIQIEDGLETETVTAISAGLSFSLVLTENGEVYSFGSEGGFQLGHVINVNSPQQENQLSPKKIDLLSNETLMGVKIKAISAGGSHSVVLTEEDEVYSFGTGTNGRLGYGFADSLPRRFEGYLAKINDPIKFKAISGGYSHTIAIGEADDGLTYSVDVSLTGEHVFYPKILGYTESIAETVTITNSGTGTIANLNVSIINDDADNFEFVSFPPSSNLVGTGASTTFHVRPKLGLDEGTHSATVLITADHGVSESFTMSFEVTPELTYSVIVSQVAPIDFGTVSTGYSSITPTMVTVTRTGTGDIEMDSIAFDKGEDSAFLVGTLAAGTILSDNVKSIVFPVRPDDNLPYGVYTDTLRIVGDHGIEESFDVSFTVVASPVIVEHPANAVVLTGRNATFNVDATGSNLTYQWQVDTGSGFADIPDETGDTLVLSSVTRSMNGNQYRVIVTGLELFSATSNSATLTVNNLPYVPTEQSPNRVKIIVNGQELSAGTVTETQRGDQSVTTVNVDRGLLIAKLEEEGEGALVTIPVNIESDVIQIELSGDIIEDLEDNEATLRIETGIVVYTLPAKLLNIQQIAEKLGQSVPLQDIRLTIEIAEPTAEQLKQAEEAATNESFELVIPPVVFVVKASYGDSVVEISTFAEFVERQILLPDSLDPNRITTGIVVEEDGTVRHVPTKIIQKDDSYHAVINSLTNSTYALIWNPVEFEDAQGHWAEDAITDVSSRLVAEGTGNGLFNPNESITRAEFVAIIVRALGLRLVSGETPFSDVSEGNAFSAAIHAAFAYELVNGNGDGTFRPDEEITREQAMIVLAKAMAITKLNSSLVPVSLEQTLRQYQDADAVSSWALRSVADSVQAGIIRGRSATELAPQAPITRAEAVAIAQRLLQLSKLI